MYDRFTDRARKVMQLASQESQRFNHEYIGTEHVLIGLLKEGSGVAAHALKNLGADLGTLRLEVEKIVQMGPSDELPVVGKLPITPRTKVAIQFAMDEAEALSHSYVGTEHLLLGLIREEQGVAAVILKNLGISADAVRAEVNAMLGIPSDEKPPVLPLTTRVWLAGLFGSALIRAGETVTTDEVTTKAVALADAMILRLGGDPGGRVMSDVSEIRADAEQLVEWARRRRKAEEMTDVHAKGEKVALAWLADHESDEAVERSRFEAWVSAPPFEYNLRRFGPADAWPGNYVSLGVQLAWEAWKERGGTTAGNSEGV